ncbi:malto-oligosyltrehalose synthase [Zavarzinia sp. CC-PAN008]|uniref:malto-oligosyltrehalose synthase n=1 Tax=Zavarzinia sp. CC-PAN008 TaxID=3243332 RepID=UPI003F748CA8
MTVGPLTATYRVQFSAAFTFRDCLAIVPYLAQLGISHLYASPFLKARAGSTHGYDIVDHNQLNPEIGSNEDFEALSDALAVHGIGLILDFVPNHMGVGQGDNAWWLDVLEWGPDSPHAASFDIDWNVPLPGRQNTVLLPILGDSYGAVLEAGDIQLRFDGEAGRIVGWYFDHCLPIRPNRYGEIVRRAVAHAGAGETPPGRALLDVVAAWPGANAPRRDQAPTLHAALAAVPGAAEVMTRGLAAYDAGQGGLEAAGILHRLLERQHYRLASWRVAVSEINYRRFFDVNDLAGLRVEDRRTFTAVHKLVARLVAAGRLHGLRLDHIDGLFDPVQYCDRLARLVRRARPRAKGRPTPFPLLVEKILGPGEALPELPGVTGETGYAALNMMLRLFVDPAGEAPLEAAWRTATGETASYSRMLEAAKLRVLETMLASEFTVLARALHRIAQGHWRTRDFAFDRLAQALRSVIVAFPVYRTYVDGDGASPADRELITRVTEAARRTWFGPDGEIFDFIRDCMSLDLLADPQTTYSAPRVRRFAMKLQQLTGPVMAKSLEDTLFYRHVRLLALNEVGGEPEHFGTSVTAFHAEAEARQAQMPGALTATATHDTKRGEDARLRIAALSELAPDWARAVEDWRALNRRALGAPPSPTHEYLVYQALVGAWEGVPAPGFADRFAAYVQKAAREGKVETSWMHPDTAYEAALDAWVRGLLDPGRSAEFHAAFQPLAERAARLGALSGLSQTVLKCCIPGVPDIYQGTELQDLSLVDPDNRRPVDYPRRSGALPQAADALAQADWAEGLPKLGVLARLLPLRRRHPVLVAQGRHVPIVASGRHAARVVAFERRHRDQRLVVVVGRLLAPLTDGGRRLPGPQDWADTVLPDLGQGLRPVLDGAPKSLPRGSVRLADLFPVWPVAVLLGA